MRERRACNFAVKADQSYFGLVVALQAEAKYAKTILARVDRMVDRKSDDYWTLHVSPQTADILPDDAEGWTASGEGWSGDVVATNRLEGSLDVKPAFRSRAPGSGSRLELRERDVLAGFIRRMRERAERNNTDKPLPGFAVLRGVKSARSQVALGDHPSLRDQQREAVIHALQNNLTLIWGPPGTGKTYTIGVLVRELAASMSKVLVVAPTNAAADNAVISIDNALESRGNKVSEGYLVRPGRANPAFMQTRPHLMAWESRTAEAAKAVLQCKNELRHAEEDASKTPKNEALPSVKNKAKAALDAARERLATCQFELLRDARVIVTTVASAILREQIAEALRGYDHAVVIDEASMVPRYALVPLCEAQPSKVVLCGDYKQLRPVRKSSNPHDQNSIFWVADSVFAAAGLVRPEDEDKLVREGTLVMLDEQNRMPEDLCGALSRTYYNRQLRTVSDARLRAPFPTLPRGARLLVDVGRHKSAAAGGTATKHREHTRDDASACKAAALVADLWAPGMTILVVTPFREQAKILRQKLHGFAAPAGGNGWVRAGTIHVAQGIESDVVVLDLVNPFHPWLLGDRGDDASRLFCVAFSRATRQIFVVGESRLVRIHPLLRELCRDAKEHSP